MKRTVCAVFDIDDTLYLERDYVQSGFAAVDRWAAKWLCLPNFGERCWQAFNAGRRRAIFNDVLREFARPAPAELISTLVEVYRTHMPSITLAPDAIEALAAISRTASIAVISDGPAVSQSRKAEALGLDSFASRVILTELLGSGFSKPHPKAFEQVQQCCPASVYLYIADNPLKDFIAPRQLGWTTVRVRRAQGLHYTVENPAVSPDHEMTDCAGLPEVLAQLV